jgi:hypothetical protein
MRDNMPASSHPKKYIYLSEREMLGRRASLIGELARLPNSNSRQYENQKLGAINEKKVKLPCLISHSALTGGII